MLCYVRFCFKSLLLLLASCSTSSIIFLLERRRRKEHCSWGDSGVAFHEDVRKGLVKSKSERLGQDIGHLIERIDPHEADQCRQ